MRKSELRSFIWRAEADALLTAREACFGLRRRFFRFFCPPPHVASYGLWPMAYGLWPMMRRVAVAGAGSSGILGSLQK
eukprot:6716005-Prymnesium_polylepis.1